MDPFRTRPHHPSSHVRNSLTWNPFNPDTWLFPLTTKWNPDKGGIEHEMNKRKKWSFQVMISDVERRKTHFFIRFRFWSTKVQTKSWNESRGESWNNKWLEERGLNHQTENKTASKCDHVSSTPSAHRINWNGREPGKGGKRWDGPSTFDALTFGVAVNLGSKNWCCPIYLFVSSEMGNVTLTSNDFVHIHSFVPSSLKEGIFRSNSRKHWERKMR